MPRASRGGANALNRRRAEEFSGEITTELFGVLANSVSDGATHPLFDDQAGELVRLGVEAGVIEVPESGLAMGRHAGLASPARLDVTDPLEVEAVVGEEVVGRCGRLDILVNNAGVTRDALVFKMSDEDWSSVLQVHLTGAFLCSLLKTLCRSSPVPGVRANSAGLAGGGCRSGPRRRRP